VGLDSNLAMATDAGLPSAGPGQVNRQGMLDIDRMRDLSKLLWVCSNRTDRPTQSAACICLAPQNTAQYILPGYLTQDFVGSVEEQNPVPPVLSVQQTQDWQLSNPQAHRPVQRLRILLRQCLQPVMSPHLLENSIPGYFRRPRTRTLQLASLAPVRRCYQALRRARRTCRPMGWPLVSSDPQGFRGNWICSRNPSKDLLLQKYLLPTLLQPQVAPFPPKWMVRQDLYWPA
jgi:hypothetical protein